MANNQGVVVRQLGPLVRAMQNFFRSPNDAIPGDDPSVPFGPLQPMKPMFPEGSEPRRFTYQVGQNLTYTPRQGRLPASRLRDLAEYDIVRSILETQYDAIVSTPWVIRAKPCPGEKNSERSAREKNDPMLAQLNRFFEYPDGRTPWKTWLRPLLDDLFVIDAPSIIVRRSNETTVSGLVVTDGAAIACYIDPNGLTPQPPAPAYAQLWNGIPSVNMTTQQLVYMPRNVPSRELYGKSPIEQGAGLIELGIERLGWQKRFYTDGSIPDALMIVPPGVTPEKIAEQQESMNSAMAGNLAVRRELRLIQGFSSEGKDQIVFPKEGSALSDVTDDYVIRCLCYLLGASPQRLLKMQNRATAQGNQEASEEEGLRPYLGWVADLVNYMLRYIFGLDQYEFAHLQETELDAAKRATADASDVGAGIITRNEARDARGLDPSANPLASVLCITTMSGVTELGAEPEPDDPDDDDEDDDEDDDDKPGGKPKPPKTKGTGKARAGAVTRKGKPLQLLHVVTGQITVENKQRQHAMQTAVQSFLGKAAALTVEHVVKHYKPRAEKLAKSDDDKEANKIADGVEFPWADLAAEVQPYLVGAGQSGVATSKQTIQLLRGVRMTVTVESAEGTAKSGSQVAAEDRAAELVGMKKNADGTYSVNPDARWAISDTTRDGLRRLISRAFEEGWSVDRLRDEIQASALFSDERAAKIANTEITQAQADGNERMWKATGAVKTVKWTLSADHKCCDVCDTFAKKGPVPLGYEFAPGITKPGAHPFCECALIIHELNLDKAA